MVKDSRIPPVSVPMHAGHAVVVALSLLVALASPARADDDPGQGDASQAAGATPFGRNSLGVELTGALLVEAWNLNERREYLAGANVAIWWAFRERAALVVEMHATRVYQDRPRHGFVQGLAPLVRWQVYRADTWAFFAEAGPGISWSDTRVPPRGTRFNLLAIGSAGVTHRINTHSEAIVGFRWLHLSNAGREGRARNPDIEALGPYAGVRFSF
jgi:hypothetical protein